MIFYESIYEACKAMEPEERAQTYEAVIAYGCAGILPENICPIAKAVFTMAKPLMDASKQSRVNGAKGGRPKKEKSTNKFVNYEQSDTDWDEVADKVMETQG